MKTTLFPTLTATLFLLLFLSSGRAQDVFVSGAPGSVTYYAVTPQAPVAPPPPVYAPPPMCRVPCACAWPTPCPVPVTYCPPVSANVIYFGGPYGTYARAIGSYPGSSVYYFGHGQAYQQGYLFGLPR